MLKLVTNITITIPLDTYIWLLKESKKRNVITKDFVASIVNATKKMFEDCEIDGVSH